MRDIELVSTNLLSWPCARLGLFLQCPHPLFPLMGFMLFVVMILSRLGSMVAVCMLGCLMLLYLDVYILAVYRPPFSSLLQDKNLISFISNLCVGRKVVIRGDFNLPSLDWSVVNVIGDYVPLREMLFFDSFSLLRLCQWAKKGTFVDSNNILDIVLTT